MYKLLNNLDYFKNKSYTFIIAEAGSNWKCGTLEQDLEQTKKMIDIADESGADAIKFQVYSSSSVYVENAGNVNYLSKENFSDINTLFDYNSMPYEMIPELFDYCQTKIIFF